MNKKFIGLFSILFILVIFLLVFFSFEGNQKRFVELLDSLDKSDKEVLQVKNISGSNFHYVNGRIFTFNGEKLTAMDMEENPLWQKTFLIPDLQFEKGSTRVAVYNKQLGEVYVYNTGGETLFELKLNKEIMGVKVYESGVSIHSKELARDQITFYDYKGDVITELNYNDTYLVNYYMLGNDIYTSEVVPGSNGFLSNFITHKGNNKAIDFYIENEILIRREKMGSSQVYLTDEGIKFVKGNEVIWEKDFPIIKDILVDGEEIYVLYGDNFQVLNKAGEEIKQYTLALNYTKIYQHGKYIVLVGDKDIVLYLHREEVSRFFFLRKIKAINSQFNELVVTLEDGISVLRIEDVVVKKED